MPLHVQQAESDTARDELVHVNGGNEKMRLSMKWPFGLPVLLFLLAACGPVLQTRPDVSVRAATLQQDSVTMTDGYVLPLRTWSAAGHPHAMVLALHGFNDYSNAFDAVGRSFAREGIITYAIDQRGFGNSRQRSIWAGYEVMRDDLLTVAQLLCERHPDLPLFLLGESMGGGVILTAAQQLPSTCARGVVLSAPAVWGWQAMPWWQTLPLRFLATLTPGHTMTGEGLDIIASDNNDMLRALGRDPLVIKETRVDAMYGLTNLMEAALVNSHLITLPTLFLYGERDEIITPGPFCLMLGNLPDRMTGRWRLVLYPEGYHMLSRDLQGARVITDMAGWVQDQEAPIRSGFEVTTDRSRLRALKHCDMSGRVE